MILDPIRIASYVLGFMAIIAAAVGIIKHHDAKVKAGVVQDINDKGQKTANAANNDRVAAERSANLERLRKSQCRDC